MNTPSELDDSVPQRASTRALSVAAAVVCAILLLGLILAVAMTNASGANPAAIPPANVFYVLFTRNEAAGCGLQLIGAAGLYFAARRGLKWFSTPISDSFRRYGFTLLALVTVAITTAGTEVVYHRYGLSMDEYCADFQAAIFARGKVSAPLPEKWQQISPWITPGFVVRDKLAHSWSTAYLPVYAGMRAVFHLVGQPWLLNPLLAGLSVLAIAAAARRMWPESAAAPWLAALFLVSSAQFLITSMSAYSMPAHLALNIVWLWLYARQDRLGMVLAPVVGFFAVGLHQPNVHLLFAFPFGFRLLWQKRWGWAAYYALAYVGALAAWMQWWHWLRPDAVSESGQLLNWPSAQQWLIQSMNLSLIVSWQSLIVGLLAVVALCHWKTLSPFTRDLAWSCLFTFISYLAFASTQGHGWGYRYFYAVLGNLVLLAVAGWEPFCRMVGEARARTLAGVSVLTALLVLFPLRAMQAEAMIAPFAEADAALSKVKAGVVLIDPMRVWYACDLVRNDPFLEQQPVRAFAVNIPLAVLQRFKESGSVAIISDKQLEEFGLVRLREPVPGYGK